MNWLKASLFSRGVLGALALLGAAEGILPYSALDLVAGMHAVMLGWNSITSAVAALIGPILNFPDFPHQLVSAGVIALTIGPAYSYSIVKSEWGQHKGAVQNTAFGTRGILALVEVFLFSVLVVGIRPDHYMFYAALLPLLLITLVTLRRIRSFRSGFLLVLGFLFGMEGVYLVSTDRVQAAFDSFVCKHQSDVAPRCQS